MKIFMCTDHDTHWPVGGASVVVAKNHNAAKKSLDKALVLDGLKPFKDFNYTLAEVDTEKAEVFILRNGEY